MKYIFLLIFFLFVQNFSAQSQIQGILKYKVIMNDKKAGTTTQERIVYFNNRFSVERAGKSFFKEIDKNDETRGSVTIVSKKPFFIYKNFPNKTLRLSDNVGRRDYLVKDTLSNFKWKITKETKKILNFNCIKAITQFRGRNYEAWYTEEIPIQNGPWKFSGLPGLIVKINDSENSFIYELTGIDLKAKFDENIIAIPKEYEKDKPISHREFMVLYKKKLDDYYKLSKVVQTSKNGSYGSVTIILPEKMEKF